MPELSAVGIDLGTTYSSLAIVDSNGKPEIVPNAEGERLTPSAVLFDDDGIVVGQIARDAAVRCPDRVVMFIKHQMGNRAWHYTYRNQEHSPTDVSAMILAKLKRDAEQHLGRPLQQAVITVPAYFDDDRRRATRAAGEIAGFQVLGLLNEPTAAAIAFGVERSQREETVLVYDLGGGTFDVTIMHVAREEIRVIATDGDHQLGGKDFDDALIGFVVERFAAEHGFNPTRDLYTAEDLRVRAEKAKRELSLRPKTQVLLRAGDQASTVEVRREQFEALIKVKLDTTLTIVRSALQAAQLAPAQIDRVLLIGGSTRIPAVRALLRQFFGRDPDVSVNPDEAVALGAGLMAARKALEIAPEEVAAPVAEKIGGLQITDVTSHSVGIEAVVPGTQQRVNSILIPRNSPIPVEVAKEFLTTDPGQRAIKVTIYQGESPVPDLCNPIGEFVLAGLPPGRPAGCKVRVTVACTTDGVISVTALDIETGKQTTTQVSYRVGPSAEQVSAKQRWLRANPVV